MVQWLACWAHNRRSKRAKLHEHVQNRTPEQNVAGCLVLWYDSRFVPARAHFRAHCCFNRRCFCSPDSRTNCGFAFIFSGADSAAHWGQIVDSRSFLLSPTRLKKSSFAPAGRRRSSSSRREVFDGPLSGQSVYEQTSGVLQHTESVRDDKVQEQYWRQALEQKLRAPPAHVATSHHDLTRCQAAKVSR